MRASFKNDFLSIGYFDDVELQDLSVLCGLNGAGKTHFLKAIQAGSVDVDGIERSGIQYFDLGSFQISKQSEELNISLAHKPKVIDELYSSFMAKIKGQLVAARVSLGSGPIDFPLAA